MKSLDGLIKALEEITSLTEDESESEGYFLAMDSIHYLKEYQEHLKWHAYEEHCLAEEKKALREKSRTDNLPLSWEELKNMQGKPIWVEYEGYTPGWEIIEHIGVYKWTINTDDDEIIIETNSSILHKEEQGKMWQAYKKEKI